MWACPAHKLMNLLITGGAGFIGSYFVKHALGQKQVAKLVNLDCLTYAADLRRLEGSQDDARYVFEEVDLREETEVARVVRQHEITHVAHLAAETHVDRSIADPGVFVRSNVNGTLHLLNACRAWWQGETKGVFLHISTDEVYGSLEPDDRPFTEESPLRPNSPYAASKAGADCLVRSYGKTYGLPVILTRCSNNYGPGQYPEKLIPVVIQSALQRRPIPVYGDGLNVRDWLHVADHCTALWEILTRGRVGETYNIGGHHELTNLRLVEMICERVDAMMPELGGGTTGLISLVQDRAGHDRRYGIDSSKLERELGWTRQRPFKEGMETTIRWYAEAS